MADLNFAAVHETSVRSTQTERYIGQMYGESPEVITAINVTASATDVWTPSVGGAITTIAFTAPNAASSTTYTIASSASAAALAEALGDLGTDLGRAVTQWYLINQTTAALTAKNPGVTGTFTDTTNVTWTHTTTGSTGTDLTVGRLVIGQGKGSAPGAVGVNKCRLPAASTTLNPTSKQVITFTPSAGIAAGDQLRLVVRASYLPRGTCTIEASHDTNLATTLANLVTDANTILDLGIDAGGLGSGFGVVASEDDTTLILTADVKGYAFDADLYITNGAAGTMTLTSKVYTTGAPGKVVSDIVPSILGIVGRGGQASLDSSGNNVVKPLRLAEVGKRGYAMVANSQSPSMGDLCWLDPSTGLLYNAGASGYIPLPADKIRWTGVNQSDAAEVEIRF